VGFAVLRDDATFNKYFNVLMEGLKPNKTIKALLMEGVIHCYSIHFFDHIKDSHINSIGMTQISNYLLQDNIALEELNLSFFFLTFPNINY